MRQGTWKGALPVGQLDSGHIENSSGQGGKAGGGCRWNPKTLLRMQTVGRERFEHFLDPHLLGVAVKTKQHWK